MGEPCERTVEEIASDLNRREVYWPLIEEILDAAVETGSVVGLERGENDLVVVRLLEYPASGIAFSGSLVVDGDPAVDVGLAPDEGVEVPDHAVIEDYFVTCIEEGLDFLELHVSEVEVTGFE